MIAMPMAMLMLVTHDRFELIHRAIRIFMHAFMLHPCILSTHLEMSELLHLGVDLRDYYAPHVDKAMVLCVGHKVKDFVQQLARLFESGKDSLLDVKAMERVAQEEMAAEDPKFQPLVYPFHRATDMQGESALAFLVSAA